MDDRLWLGRIHIVEWLRTRDRKTGWELFDELQPMGIMSKPAVDVTFDRVATRAEFIALLRRFEDQYRADGRRPVLHIETHGADDGIGNPETDGLSWNELAKELTGFNRLTRLNLVLVLGACHGAWGVKMLQLDRRAAAFRGLIGPDQEMDDVEVRDAALAFYRGVFRQGDGNVAFQAMNEAVAHKGKPFHMWSAEVAFKIVYRHYLATRCSAAQVAQRAHAIASRVGARVKAAHGVGRFRWEIERDRKLAEKWLGDHQGRFEEMRRDFFFIHQFPENDTRFNVKMEDCLPEAWPPDTSVSDH